MTSTAPKRVPLTDALSAYLEAHSTPLDPVQRRLIDETRELGDVAVMQVAPEQGALMAMLVRLVGARHGVEVGTFTGDSSLAMALALPPDGWLVCCDVYEGWTAMARRHWAAAGVDDRIELRIAPAIRTLRALPTGERQPRLHRRRQGQLRGVLRGAPAPRMPDTRLVSPPGVLWARREQGRASPACRGGSPLRPRAGG